MNALPDIGWAQRDIRLLRSESASRSGNRLTNVVEFADPVWTVSLESLWLTELELFAFEAWRDGLRGAMTPILYRDPGYASPAAHIRARGPEAQGGTVASVTSGNVVRVNGVNAGLVLARGDFVTFESGAARALGRIVTATGTGTTRTITIEPVFARHLPTTGATARFDRIELVMRQVPSSFSVRRQSNLHAASFDLMEARI